MIKEFDNFLTEEECNLIIGIGESNTLNSGITYGSKIGYRKARVTWLYNPLIESIKNKIEELTNLPKCNQEDFHFIKYEIGGEYKPHYDGETRPKTALIYLNDGFKGGETEFPKLGLKIKPKTGKLIIWDNSTIDGVKDEMSLHSGLPVELVNKYIGVIWIKNKKIT